MSSRLVTCPGCKTQLKINAAGKVKVTCPKCSKVLMVPAAATAKPTTPGGAKPQSASNPPAAQRPPAQNPAAQKPAAQRPPSQRPAPQPTAPADDPFSNLPGLPAGGFPAAGAGGVPAYRSAPPKPAAKKSKKQKKPAKPKNKKGTGGSSATTKVLGILGGVALVGLLLCGGGVALVATGVLGPKHSGWQTITFEGCTLNMPGKGNDRTKTQNQGFGVVIKERAFKRAESGSEYSIAVSQLPNMPDGSKPTLDLLVENMKISMSNRKPVTRSGVKGYAGTITSGASAAKGSEVEIFIKDGKLVLTAYSPYSKIKDLVGGTRAARPNERELDKPEQFFESLKIQ
ncbi:MAG: hypothetical protein HKN47_12655 [Pirellulaceae bacterium]|nr:hypothetical protein [Pirellulaceae bacterium]